VPTSSGVITGRAEKKKKEGMRIGEGTETDHEKVIAEKRESENKSDGCVLIKATHLQSDAFATGCSRADLDTAYTGRDPIPDLKSGSAR
jgi:hypothetical protein